MEERPRRGPQVDKIAPLRLDLDFLDTSGYAMLPVETPAVPVDASAEKVPPRPASEISLVQTLDERLAKEGKLVLEIRATAQGLVPELSELVDLKLPGFRISATDGGDVSVTQFDKTATETVVNSERTWLVTMQADEKQAQPPEKFSFVAAKMPVKENVYQRYQDADLVAVESEIDLNASYAKRSYAWLWLVCLGLGVVVVGAVGARGYLRSRRKPAPARFRLPPQLNAFTVLGLLRDIQANNGLAETDQAELAASIATIEQHYFAESDGAHPNLHDLAQTWIQHASSR